MTPIEKYLEHLDRIFQVEPKFFREKSLDGRLPGVVNIVYTDIPEKGMTTVITYGLSMVTHEDWKLGRPELCISVDSKDSAWEAVAGYVANRLRGKCAFQYGEQIDFKEKIADDSDMDSFLVFAPSLKVKII